MIKSVGGKNIQNLLETLSQPTEKAHPIPKSSLLTKLVSKYNNVSSALREGELMEEREREREIGMS